MNLRAIISNTFHHITKIYLQIFAICKAIPLKEITINRRPKTDTGGRLAKLSMISIPSFSMEFPYPKSIWIRRYQIYVSLTVIWVNNDIVLCI